MGQRNKKEIIILVVILLFVVIFAFSKLTSRPALWFDEGLNIEIAHNILLFQKMDVFVAPSVFSGIPFVVGTNGYPLTMPLAGFFAVFGFGLVQARIFMILWMIVALLSVYHVTKSIFGKKIFAILAVAFISTFASFYANGLSVMAEIPGFVLMLWGLFYLTYKRNYFLVGIFFSLAMVSKPSIYLYLFPTLFLFLLFKDRQKFFYKLSYAFLGSLPPFLVWVFLNLSNPFALSAWQEVFSFFKDPYGTSVWENILRNLSIIPTDMTLVYFGVFAFVVTLAFFIGKKFESRARNIICFSLIYIVFLFLFFLKGPGWFRYLLSLQLLLLVFISPALFALFERIKVKKFWVWGVVIFLLCVQIFQLLFLYAPRYSSFSEEIFNFVNAELEKQPDAMVGIIRLPQVAAFIDNKNKIHFLKTLGNTSILGNHPLSFKKDLLPEFIVSRVDNVILDPYRDILKEQYRTVKQADALRVWQRVY